MSLKNDSDPLLPCALEITQFVRACMTDKKAWNRKCTKTKFNVSNKTNIDSVKLIQTQEFIDRDIEKSIAKGK